MEDSLFQLSFLPNFTPSRLGEENRFKTLLENSMANLGFVGLGVMGSHEAVVGCRPQRLRLQPD